ncbi:hypothetical protein PENTCL1PPCAC_25447, partial [Pristionchus entomophagus]
LGRCLQYRRGISERVVRSHWSKPSSSQTTEPSTEKPTAESNDVDFATNFKNLLPSQQLRRTMSDAQNKQLDHLIKQVELYCYMAKKVPTRIYDESWRELLEMRTVLERVCKLEFYAVKERREERDMSKSNEALFKEFLEGQAVNYNAGGMGYGPGMHELIANPLRRKARLNLVDGARIYQSLRLADNPTIVMDMQYVFDGKHRGEFNIKRQLQYLITENMHASRPLPLIFSNVANNIHGRGYMEKSLGYWSGEYLDQTILPDVEAVGPREALIKRTGKKKPKIVYVSRFAKNVLDGPLRADAYVLCASYDQQRESIIAAHKDHIEAFRLPIDRYVKWEQGPKVIPFPNLMRIFREVMDSGGDWKTAFYNNISKRHIEPMNPEVQAIRQSMRESQVRERSSIISAIIDSYGEHP